MSSRRDAVILVGLGVLLYLATKKGSPWPNLNHTYPNTYATYKQTAHTQIYGDYERNRGLVFSDLQYGSGKSLLSAMYNDNYDHTSMYFRT